MKIPFDRETDTLTIVLTKSVVAESDENYPAAILHDAKGNLVFLPNISSRIPRSVVVSRLLQSGATVSKGTGPDRRLFMLAHSRRR